MTHHTFFRPFLGWTHHFSGRRLGRSLCIAAAVLLLWPAAGLHAADTASAPDMDRVRAVAPRVGANQTAVVLHYHRPDGAYEGWNVWMWADGQEGVSVPFRGKSAFGVHTRLELPVRLEQLNFIVRKGEWEAKDVDHDRSVSVNEDGVAEAWLVADDPQVYADPKAIDFGVKVRAAFLDAMDHLSVTLTRPARAGSLDTGEASFTVGGRAVDVASAQTVEPSQNGFARRLRLQLSEPLGVDDLSQPMVLELPGLRPTNVLVRDALVHPDLAPLDAELGAFHEDAQTTFRTWSPVAEKVELILFESYKSAQPMRTVALKAVGSGLWETTVQGDLHGTYYRYRFTSQGQTRNAVDIHAFAASADSQRAMVVDLSRTDPPGFREHAPPTIERLTDEIIYEIHVRDYSVRDATAPEAHRGKYLGLVHPGVAGKGDVSTGVSHLKDLGVTAVHLLPIQDFGSERHEYNWGYWTSLFNVPEAQYSTSPDDPAQTIRELKQMIQELHDNDIRVILDVVYNHTSSSGPSSPFEQTVPAYYFRTEFDGRLRNDAGVGNSIADERPMVRKYIADSLEFWTREYKIDGYRFDLVGTHHPETVRHFTDRLRAIRPDITLYGEPWTGGGPTYFPKGAQRGTGFAVFNDHLRNAVRGDLDGASTGFGTGPGGDAAAVEAGVAGAIDDFAEHPHESVNYVSAHDNRTFWDKLEYTHERGDRDTFIAMQKLAHGVVLTSQGIAFIHGAADFARTKGGNHNSYNAGDAVNKFDWERKAEFIDMHRYIAGLVTLRRAQPAFRMADADEVRANLRELDAPDGVVAFALNGEPYDGWGTIVVAYNGEPESKRVSLPSGEWSVVVNAEAAGVETLDRAKRTATLPPYSMWVGYRD